MVKCVFFDFPVTRRRVGSVIYEPEFVTDCAFHRRLPLFAFVSYQGYLNIINLDSLHLNRLPLPFHTYDIVRFLGNNEIILSSLGGDPDIIGRFPEGKTTVINIESGAIIDRFWTSNVAIDFLPGEHTLLLGESGQNAGLIRFICRNSDGKFTGYDFALGLSEGFCDFRTSSSGRYMIVLGKTEIAYYCLFDISALSCVHRQTWLTKWPNSNYAIRSYPTGAVFFNHDLQVLIPNYIDEQSGLISIRIDTGETKRLELGHAAPVNAIDASANSRLVVSGDLSGVVNTTATELDSDFASPELVAILNLNNISLTDCHNHPVDKNTYQVNL